MSNAPNIKPLSTAAMTVTMRDKVGELVHALSLLRLSCPHDQLFWRAVDDVAMMHGYELVKVSYANK